MQTLDIIAEHEDKFRVVALAAGSNVTLLADQVGDQSLPFSFWFYFILIVYKLAMTLFTKLNF